jgi:hypothetical protein
VYYTYAHFTPNKNLFYIGKGNGRRAYIFHKRNNHWNNIVKKHGKPEVQILAHWSTEAEAFDHEKLLISCFKDMGHTLCNMSEGGEGASGPKHSEEFKQRIRELHTGSTWNLGRPTSAKQKQVASQLGKGNKYAAGNTNNRRWRWIGTSLEDGSTVVFIGSFALNNAGFQHANVIKCLNGTRKSHKGYTWSKEPLENT